MQSDTTPIMETQRLILRRFTEKDAVDFLELMQDAEVNTFLPWFPLKTLDDSIAFLEERFFSYDSKPNTFRYAICSKENHRLIGYAWLSDNESHDFGYGLQSAFWHQGIVTEAASAVLEKIKAAGYPYITATHDINNPRSGEVMKKLGMTYRYSYIEQWQPKDFPVTFRLYQLNFDGNDARIYMEYWDKSARHFIEQDV